MSLMSTSAGALTDRLTQFTGAVVVHLPPILKTSNFRSGLVTAFVGYLALVQVLRFRRYRQIHKKYQRKYEEKTLTPEEAQKIMFVTFGYDMPLLINYSLAFALFKTYAIPTISKLLAGTKQLKSRETISRRYADTEILSATWVACPISGYNTEDKLGELDPRAMIALARVNYLHSKYKISNGDFLYTLILFALEPVTWAKRYGWRSFSPMEEYASCIFWAEIGKRMGIQDIPDTPNGMRTWAKAYEEEHSAPDPVNKEVSEYTTEELLYAVPTTFGLRERVEGLTICMLDEPARIAMMKPSQSWYKHLFVWSVLRANALVQRWLMLPRSDSNYRFPIKIGLTRNSDGSINPRMQPNKFAVRPWYRPEATTLLEKVWHRFLVFTKWHSGLPKPSLHSNGYRLEEMGPAAMEHSGNAEVLKAAADLLGCPITGAFAR